MSRWQLNGMVCGLCLLLASVSCSSGKYHPPAYHPLVRTGPDEADRWYNLGIAYSTLDRHEESVAAFSRELKVRTDDANALFRIGHEYRALGKADSATVYLKKAFESGEINATHSSRGIGLFMIGKDREAIDELNRGLREEDPRPVQILQHIGLACSRLQMYDAAVKAFLEAIRKNPDTAEEYNISVNLGVQYHALKQYRNAIGAYRESLKRNPRNYTAILYMGYAFAELGDRTAALQQYEILKTHQPSAAEQLFAYVSRRLPATASQ